MSLRTLSLVAFLAASVQSLPHNNTRVTYADSKQHLRDDWVLATSQRSDMALSPSPPTHELLFCVKQNNLPKLKSLLESISDPSSPRFQQYLSFSQVGDILNNTQGVTAVVDWLTASGANVTSVTPRGEYISASAPLALWSQLLDTEFYTMRHIQSSHRISRCNTYSLPQSIAQHVQSVAHTTQLPLRHQAPRLRQPATTLSGQTHYGDPAVGCEADEQAVQVQGLAGKFCSPDCASAACPTDVPAGVTAAPQCALKTSASEKRCALICSASTDLKSLRAGDAVCGKATCQSIQGTGICTYGAAPGPSRTVNLAVLRKAYNLPADSGSQTHGSQAVFETDGQSYSPEDLSTFAKREGFVAPKINDIGGHVVKDCSGDECIEANLDVQYITGVAPKVPTTFWFVTKTTSFYEYLVAVAQQKEPVLVHSISYGADERALESSVKDSFDTEMIKLGLMGVTVMAATGDDGVAGQEARPNLQGKSACGYNPSFPASSPYVTAVGATQGIEAGGPELACGSSTGGQISTGGGFSDYYEQPKWQASAVAGYFAAGKKAAGGYDKSGRGYPDVALAGYNYETIINGFVSPGSGTSASTPVFAGFVSLVNSARLAAGKPPVGFLNPALYAPNATDIYNDVTSGFNNCAAKELACCKQGFHAAKGWDPLTGWGSVDFAKFAERMV